MNAVAVPRSTPPTTPPAEGLVDAVHGTMRAVLHRLHPALEAEGISMGQFWTLHLVSSLRSPSMGTVARHLSLSAPTVCASIDQLEASGLISRRRSARDRRAVEVALTARGRRVEAKVWSEIGRVMASAVEELPGGDVEAALRVFREVARRLDPETGEGVA
jgi:DNA-binding MarR family transcriptional regulator